MARLDVSWCWEAFYLTLSNGQPRLATFPANNVNGSVGKSEFDTCYGSRDFLVTLALNAGVERVLKKPCKNLSGIKSEHAA